MKKVHLITIDGQNDFCAFNTKQGALYVGTDASGAEADVRRLARFVNKVGDRLAMIHSTLDSHHPQHIAHAIMWTNSKGEQPPIFNPIFNADLVSGKWFAHNPRLRAAFQNYTNELEKHNRYVLVIWPQHCIIGSWGHALYPELSDAFIDWQNKYHKRINYVAKGSNMLTEHYSAVQADVPDDADPTTKLNTQLIDLLAKNADEILITGQALSHCVANTIQDIADNFGEDNIKKFTLLEDTCSNVPSFEKLGQDFVKTMTKRGMRTTTTDNWS